jgi:Mn-dependent DtxR family transcriptional regulator
MKNLRNAELVTVDASGYLHLTPAGREIAETMYERHTLLSDWLVYLGVDPQKAAEDACRMEHILSAESFQAIKQHVLANKEQTNQNRHA